ncbi:MAG: aminoglycoside 6-adenylyltransferase [Oscillospiraceae bacterium]|jgi:aminoglycoside 6-adenylyltransferase|nr:aminoglycoside 6-adenylyltransferase [Oscillospiraceae bacterium]
MRTEKQMTDLILNIAKEDERIRAVYMNGSRTNPNARKDTYQDYDIVYVVTETDSFITDKSWIMNFGNPLIVQEPDWNDNYAGNSGEIHDFSIRYVWLILFDDGNRIDLSIEIQQEAAENFLKDKLTVLLLDKDGMLPVIAKPSDEDYYIKKPTQNNYWACCNNFWWCLNNVAKGIARDELSYVMHMFHEVVRGDLHAMLNWYIGTQYGFALSTGKAGKYFKKYLSDDLYQQYCKTYSASDYRDIWAAVFTMCDLFHILALSVAEHFGFSYRQTEENGIRKYLNRVKSDCIK